VFPAEAYPAELNSKVSLLNHFRSFLENDLKEKVPGTTASLKSNSNKGENIY
jgi:hypothetical protein